MFNQHETEIMAGLTSGVAAEKWKTNLDPNQNSQHRQHTSAIVRLKSVFYYLRFL